MSNCIEIKKRGVAYRKILIFRIKILDFYNSLNKFEQYFEILKEIDEINEKIGVTIEFEKGYAFIICLIKNLEYNDEILKNKLINLYQAQFKIQIENIKKSEIEADFWGIIWGKKTNFALFLKEKYYILKGGDISNYLAIYSIKNAHYLRKIIDLIESLKIFQYKLFFHTETKRKDKIQIDLSLESKSLEKILQFSKISSEQLPREAISLQLATKSLFIHYLFKFLSSNQEITGEGERKLKIKLKKNAKAFLINHNFQEIRPSVYLCLDLKVIVIILRNFNLRLIKFCLKSYYSKYSLIFWATNGDLMKILENGTNLNKLKKCKIMKKKPDQKIWEKMLKLTP